MMLQSYIVTAEVQTLEPIKVGQVVYEWPHVDWGLAGPDDILICTKLQDITTIYAIPKSCLKDNGVVQASISVGKMPGSSQPEDDARVGAGLQRQRAEPAIRPWGELLVERDASGKVRPISPSEFFGHPRKTSEPAIRPVERELQVRLNADHWKDICERLRRAEERGFMSQAEMQAQVSEGLPVMLKGFPEVFELPPTNCIQYAAYDAEGKAVVRGSRSSFDPSGDMRIANAAWELTYARRRGVAIDDATFANHVTGTNLIVANDDSKIAEIVAAFQETGEKRYGLLTQMIREAFAELRGVAEMFRVRLELATEQMLQPIDMVLHCPTCGEQHIDAPEPVAMGQLTEAQNAHLMLGPQFWTNPPHRSHLCKSCGTVWRPSDVATNGVQAVKTKGRDDDPLPLPAVKRGPAEQVVALINELRAHEGDDVTLLCDDPEAATREESCAVRCCGEWTDWHEKAFMGETVLHALQAAVAAKKARLTL